jgi:exosortase A
VNILVGATSTRVAQAEGSRWPLAIGVIAVCMLAIGLIFQEEVIGAFRVWMGSATYNHCFLIVPIVFYMIWQRRNQMVSVAPQPNYRVLLIIPLLSLAWFGLSVVGILEARQFVVMTIVQATLLGVLGWPVYRRLMAPLLYLYFLVPTGEFLTPSLQDFTARFAVYGLELLNIPVYSDGTIIDIPAGTFTVAEACAGLRFLIAAVAFGVFYAVEIYESRIRRTIFIALSVVVPVIANGFRALGLIAAAEAFGSATAVEADHVTYGWIFFSLVLVALILIGRTFSDRDEASAEEMPVSAPRFATPHMRQLSAAGILALVLAAVGPAVGYAFDSSPAPVALKAQGPAMGGGWQSVARVPEGWRPRVVRADKEVMESFSDGSQQVDRFVALYLPHGRDNNLIRSDNRVADMESWSIAGRGRPTVRIGDRNVRVIETELAGGTGARRLIWSFYVLDGIVTSNVLEAKQHQVKAYFERSGCPSAFIALSVDLNGTAGRETLQRYLAAMEPLPAYLCGAAAK